jgi:type IV secretion system protein TrbC
MSPRTRQLLIFIALVLVATAAHAGTGGTSMPWNTPLQRVLDNLTGVTGKILAAFMIAIGGVMWGFTRHEEGAKRIGQAIIGIGFLLGAVSFIDLLGFEGALF